MRILVLGAGFGGLELTTRLSGELGDDAGIVLIDNPGGFVFGFSRLDMKFGRTAPGGHAIVSEVRATALGAPASKGCEPAQRT